MSNGVRAKLASLVVACVLPLTVLAAVVLHLHYIDSRNQVRAASIERARAMVSALDRDVQTAVTGLKVLSTAPQLVSGDLASFHERSGKALPDIRADAVVLIGADGQMLFTTRRPFGTPLPKLAKAPLLVQILDTKRPGISDLFVGPLGGSPIVAVGVPVLRDAQVAYTLNAIIEPVRMSAILSEQKLPASWRAAIVDSNGTVVARTHDIAKFLGKKVTRELIGRMNKADEDAFETVTLDGIEVITVYSRSAESRWAVVVGTPITELDAGIRTSMLLLGGTFCGALSLGLWFAWRVGGRIANSISALVEPARALGMEQHAAIPPLDFREANELAHALSEAAARLERARFEAMHDGLTGLANRNAFSLTLKQQLALCRRNETSLAVLYIDLDGFKAVNDAHGHGCGDALLSDVARRLQSSIRGSDLAARLGGDEFAILLVQADQKGAVEFAARLVATLSEEYRLGDVNARISASVGLACASGSEDDAETLTKRADKAMYMAKGQGKARVCMADAGSAGS